MTAGQGDVKGKIMSNDKQRKPTKAEQFMQHMVSGDQQRPMTVATDPSRRVTISDDELSESIDNIEKMTTRADSMGDGELVTPGQIMDGIFAQLINQMQRLEDRMDYLLDLAVEQGWFEKPVTKEVLDEMIEARLARAEGKQSDALDSIGKEGTDGTEDTKRTGRAFRREGKSGSGYVVRDGDPIDTEAE